MKEITYKVTIHGEPKKRDLTLAAAVKFVNELCEGYGEEYVRRECAPGIEVDGVRMVDQFTVRTPLHLRVPTSCLIRIEPEAYLPVQRKALALLDERNLACLIVAGFSYVWPTHIRNDGGRFGHENAIKAAIGVIKKLDPQAFCWSCAFAGKDVLATEPPEEMAYMNREMTRDMCDECRKLSMSQPIPADALLASVEDWPENRWNGRR